MGKAMATFGLQMVARMQRLKLRPDRIKVRKRSMCELRPCRLPESGFEPKWGFNTGAEHLHFQQLDVWDHHSGMCLFQRLHCAGAHGPRGRQNAPGPRHPCMCPAVAFRQDAEGRRSLSPKTLASRRPLE